jgi:large subunit ribosomal protein L15
MQTAFYLLSSPLMLRSLKPTPTTYRSLDGTHYEQPEPFLHNDYKSLENVTSANIDAIMDAKRLEPLINESGLIEIMRWKPARVTDVIGSGQMAIAIECLFAIVGAVALQKGGDVAARLAREKILGKNKP